MSLLLLSTTMYTQTGRPTCLFAVECISTRIAIVRAFVRGDKKIKNGGSIEARVHARVYARRSEVHQAVTKRISKVVDGNTPRWYWWWRTRSCNEGIVCREIASSPYHNWTVMWPDLQPSAWERYERDIQDVAQSKRWSFKRTFIF